MFTITPEIAHWRLNFAIMKMKFFLGAVCLLALSACNSPSAESTQSAISNADSLAASAAQAPDNQEEGESLRPTLKSEPERSRLQKQWADAVAAEKKFLGSPKLIGWIGELKSSTDEDGFDQPGKLTETQFKGLAFQEKLCYYLFHPEMASQNCSMAFFDIGLIQGISGSLPFDSEEYQSERQLEALTTQKAELEKWVLKSIETNKTVSIPMMQLIVAFELKSAITPLLNLYAAQSLKDDLLLTTCIEMMRKAEFADWVNSEVAAEMKQEMGGEYGPEMRDYAAINDANVQEVIALAKKFAGV